MVMVLPFESLELSIYLPLRSTGEKGGLIVKGLCGDSVVAGEYGYCGEARRCRAEVGSLADRGGPRGDGGIEVGLDLGTLPGGKVALLAVEGIETGDGRALLLTHLV